VVRVELESDVSSGLHRAIRGVLPPTGVEPELAPVRLLFEVQDTGIGIDIGAQERLFQSFQQADNSTTRKFGGTGLGLAICKRMVELMGGRISVASVPGAGSIFRFTVSFVPRTAPLFVPSPLMRNRRVLVVDDNATSRTLLYRWCSAWGMVCDLVADVDSARAHLETQAVAVVVLDVGHQAQQALTFARALKNDPRTAAIGMILLTPIGAQRLINDALASGIDACVDKPLRQASIHHALATALGITQARTLGHTAAHGARRRFNGRVLVAEDNAVNQRLTAAQLARFGVHADIVANGVEALTAIAQLPYDLVLMDCQMPEMDGYQATREIRHRETMTNRRRLPVIAMTANAMAGDRDLCLAAGMDDYIAKPVRIEALAEALARFLPEVTDGVPLISGPASTTIADDPDMLIDPRVLARLRDELGDETIFVEMVAIFVREAPDHVGALERALKNGDTETVRRAAHKLKGSCQIMGANRLAAFCRRVEEQARSGHAMHADDVSLQRLLDETLTAIPLSRP
jgi:CheY-like chemotaxis protein/HPt (histidine-containing phosphotransfer) domain-containing protein